jgi:hypothetical protein
MGALTADREALTVTDALVASDFDLALDIGLDISTQVTFNGQVFVHEHANLVDLVLGEGRDLGVAIETQLVTDPL